MFDATHPDRAAVHHGDRLGENCGGDVRGVNESSPHRLGGVAGARDPQPVQSVVDGRWVYTGAGLDL